MTIEKLSMFLPHNVWRMKKQQEEILLLQNENRNLSMENEKLQIQMKNMIQNEEPIYERLCELSDKEEKFYEQAEELEEIKQLYEKQRELLDGLTPGIMEMVISAIERKLEAGISGMELYEQFSDADNGKWYPYPCLVNACKKLLGDAPIYHLFPQEDCLGLFEETDPYEEMEWREKDAFGEIVDSRFCGMYEFCDYKIDRESAEYKDYQKRLYEEAVRCLAKSHPLQMFKMDPSFFKKGE